MLPAEVASVVSRGGLVVPVRRVSCRRVDRLRHRDDFIDLVRIARLRVDAPILLERERIIVVAGNAPRLLVASAAGDGDDVLAPLLRRIIETVVHGRRGEVLPREGAGVRQRPVPGAVDGAAHHDELVGLCTVERQTRVRRRDALADAREAGGVVGDVAVARPQVRAVAVERLVVDRGEVVRTGDQARAAPDVQHGFGALENGERMRRERLLQPEGPVARDGDDVVAGLHRHVLGRGVRRRGPGVARVERERVRRVREDRSDLARSGTARDRDVAAGVAATERARVREGGRGRRIGRAGAVALERLHGAGAAVTVALVRAPDDHRRAARPRPALDLLDAHAHRRGGAFVVVAQRVSIFEDDLLQEVVVVLELGGRTGPGDAVRVADEDDGRADERHAHRFDLVVAAFGAAHFDEVHDRRGLLPSLREAAQPRVTGIREVAVDHPGIAAQLGPGAQARGELLAIGVLLLQLFHGCAKVVLGEATHVLEEIAGRRLARQRAAEPRRRGVRHGDRRERVVQEIEVIPDFGAGRGAELGDQVV